MSFVLNYLSIKQRENAILTGKSGGMVSPLPATPTQYMYPCMYPLASICETEKGKYFNICASQQKFYPVHTDQPNARKTVDDIKRKHSCECILWCTMHTHNHGQWVYRLYTQAEATYKLMNEALCVSRGCCTFIYSFINILINGDVMCGVFCTERSR